MIPVGTGVVTFARAVQGHVQFYIPVQLQLYQKKKKKLIDKFISSSLLTWMGYVLTNELTQCTLPYSSVDKAKQICPGLNANEIQI